MEKLILGIDIDKEGRYELMCSSKYCVKVLKKILEGDEDVIIKSPEIGKVCPLEPNAEWKDSICAEVELFNEGK